MYKRIETYDFRHEGYSVSGEHMYWTDTQNKGLYINIKSYKTPGYSYVVIALDLPDSLQPGPPLQPGEIVFSGKDDRSLYLYLQNDTQAQYGWAHEGRVELNRFSVTKEGVDIQGTVKGKIMLADLDPINPYVITGEFEMVGPLPGDGAKEVYEAYKMFSRLGVPKL